MKIVGLFLSLIFIAAIAQADAISTIAASNQPPPVVRSAQIQHILDKWRHQANLPGVALSLYLPEQDTPLTFTSGSTAYFHGAPLNSNTLFQAGSITKSFTSMIVLQLVAEGKLSLNDPITTYLPQYPQWQTVTVRELLNHTSGIFNYTETGAFNNIRADNPRAGFTPQEIVSIAAAHPDYFYPGHGWKYSNTNYVLAGMIIKKVTGESINEVMNHYLHNYVKLHLLNTYYLSGIYPNDFLERMAHGYNTRGVDVTQDNMSWAYTAGAIVTTTQDLLAWWRDLFQGQLLPPEQLKEMMTLVCEGNYGHCRAGQPVADLTADEVGKGYGLGIIESAYGPRLGTVWWHNGSTAGYKALVMWFPQSDIYLSLAINRDPGYLLRPDLPIVRNIMNVLLPTTEWRSAHPVPHYHPILHYPHVPLIRHWYPKLKVHHAIKHCVAHKEPYKIIHRRLVEHKIVRRVDEKVAREHLLAERKLAAEKRRESEK